MDPRRRRQEEVERHSSARSNISFLERKLRILANKNIESESSDVLRGPFGLNLLYQPSETLVDFIFVHGLRGGSRKTWSKTDSPAHYWPKEWLPNDSDFKGVRIHSFGYNSDWGDKRANPLNVHDFGRSLIEEISNSSAIRRDRDTPIVLIGHSMGGLVIKKACIISKQSLVFQDLAARIHSIYFLATPHRGSKLANVLNNILRASLTHGSRQFITNVESGSEVIQVLNDEFRHYYQGIEIHSFYESVKMNLGYTSTLVVDRDSATLGYPEERIQLLNADHRGVCKFEDPSDSNYQTLRMALVSTVDSIRKKADLAKNKAQRAQMRLLSAYLNTSGKPEDELSNLEEARTGVEGSCEWLTNKKHFEYWLFDRDSPKYFWLTGKPATGKSVLAGYVVNYLGSNRDCSYYFFRHGDKVRSSVSGFLRSIAYQMASFNASIRNALIEIQQEDPQLEDNVRTIWRKIFLGGIFRTIFHQPFYWVIDALDECYNESRNYAGLFSLLAKVDENIPLRVFITSRMSSDLEKLLIPLKMLTEEIYLEDSLQDIRMYCEANSMDLPVEEELGRQELIDEIVEKSAGCFLWAVLVIRQLQDVYTEEETRKVLMEVPEEMEPLYMRNLEILSTAGRNKRLAKTVLKWVICATRSLTAHELKDAIKLDINDTVSRDLEKSLPSLCGQLVYVDRNSCVHMVHATARELLTREGLDSEFAIKKNDGHFDLAVACLKYLASDEMRVHRCKSHTVSRGPPQCALADYACASFSEHVLHSNNASDVVLSSLNTFLSSNVLSWIECMARGQNLHYLNQAANHIKGHLKHREKYRAPLGKEVQNVGTWATDLTRIVTQFGTNLLSSPTAIHLLVPPLCPPTSIIHGQFGISPFGLQVSGLSATGWHDRISSIHYRDQKASMVACRDGRFAVGLSDGSVAIYSSITCQEIRRLEHGERLRALSFGITARVLASSGSQMVKLWDTMTGNNLLRILVTSEPMSLAFDENENTLIAATKSNRIITWTIPDGSLMSNETYADVPRAANHGIGRAPIKVEISVEHKMLAILYRSMPVVLWDLESNTQLGSCARPTTRHDSVATTAHTACFNPNPDVNLIAVPYQDGELALFDTCYQSMVTLVVSDADVLASSLDGRTLAAGDSAGTIYLYDFETLLLLYRLNLPDYAIRSIAFTSDGLRFFDIRSQQCNVWEPSVLVREDIEDDQSVPSAESMFSVPESSTTSFGQSVTITTLACISHGDFLLCGKDDGNVDVYETSTGKQIQELYNHVKNIAVSRITWNEHRNVVVSVDMSSRTQAFQITMARPKLWTVKEKLLDEHSNQPIRDIIISPDGSRLLISMPHTDTIWSLQQEGMLKSITHAHRTSWKWVSQPSKPSELLLLDDTIARIYGWNGFDQLSGPKGIQLQVADGQILDLCHVATSPNDRRLAVKVTSGKGEATVHPPTFTNQILIFDLSVLDNGVSSISPLTYLTSPTTSVAPRVENLIGIVPSNAGSKLLVFMTENGWLCTINLDGAAPHDSFTRHFFLPFDWLSPKADTPVQVTEKRDMVFVKVDEIAVVKNGLENMEIISSRPKLLGALSSSERVSHSIDAVRRRSYGSPARSLSPS